MNNSRNTGVKSDTKTTGSAVADTGVDRKEGIQVEKSIIVNRSPSEVYRYWRQLENLPRWMHHLKSVTSTGNKSHWVARGPVGTSVEWDAEIVNDVPDQKIAWQSLPDADVRNAGAVMFEPVGAGQTNVRLSMRYDPPAGKLGKAVSTLLGEKPEHEIEHDLEQFKKELESKGMA